jgi:flavin-dependent dehydrogenase
MFVVGDAAGYVEPFTGEGMAWALAGAERVIPFVRAAVASWDVGLIRAWSDAHGRLVGRDQRWCRAIASGLRSPFATTTAITLLRRYPHLTRPVLTHLSAAGPSCQD